MWYIAVSLIVLGCVAAGMSYREERRRRRTPGSEGEVSPLAEVRAIPADCCGLHDVCERDRLSAAAGKEIEYYEDEELDAYRRTASDAYPEAVVDEFREVLYTLKETEVAGWLRSLQLRDIRLPDALKDEAFLLAGKDGLI
jgi:hypothetical protein